MPTDYFRTMKDFVEFAEGDVIFEQGALGRTMYAVRDGEVEIYRDDQLLETCYPGDFFGEMAIIDESTRAARAVAKTDCQLVEVTRDKFVYLVQETPTFALQVMEKMADRLRRVTGE